MPKFLLAANYTLDGIKGVRSAGGSARRDAVAQVAESVGGRLESFHFALGERDAYVVVDLRPRPEPPCRLVAAARR